MSSRISQVSLRKAKYTLTLLLPHREIVFERSSFKKYQVQKQKMLDIKWKASCNI